MSRVEITPELLRELLEKAKAATQERWVGWTREQGSPAEYPAHGYVIGPTKVLCGCHVMLSPEDATYIAAMDPTVGAAVVEELLKRLEGDTKSAAEFYEDWAGRLDTDLNLDTLRDFLMGYREDPGAVSTLHLGEQQVRTLVALQEALERHG